MWVQSVRLKTEAQVESSISINSNIRFHKEKEMVDFRKSLLLLCHLVVVAR